jgi:hypothetical protein
VKKAKKKIDFPEVKPILSHISYEESKNIEIPFYVEVCTLLYQLYVLEAEQFVHLGKGRASCRYCPGQMVRHPFLTSLCVEKK